MANPPTAAGCGEAPDTLPLTTRAAYGVGAVALGLKDNGFSYLLLLFYNQVVGLPAATVGLAIMVALCVDALLDPLIGHISDTWRSAWGRRHPFMYASALPVALSYLMLWNPPLGWSHSALAVYLAVCAVLIRTSLSLFEIPSAAMAAELTSGYDSRTRLLAWRAGFNWYGALIMSVATFQLFLRPDALHPVAQLNPTGYARYGLVSAAVMFAAILISAVGTHGHIRHLKRPPERRDSLAEGARNLVSAMLNRSLLPMLMAGVFNAMAYGLSVALALYFNTYFWGFSAAQVSLFLIAQFVSSALAIWLAGPLSERFGKRNAAILGKIIGPLFGVAPLCLRLLGLFPENGHPALLPLMLGFHLIAVTVASVVAVLHGSMITDIAEDHELASGRRAEGVFVAANIFVAKAVSGVGIFASSMMLMAAGFPQDATPATISPETVRNLALIYIPSLLAMHWGAVLFIAFYRITRASHARTLELLAAASGKAPGQGSGGVA